MIFADTNIIIDIVERDARWFDWSAAQLAQAVFSDSVAVDLVVLAECAPRFPTLAVQLEAIAALGLTVEEIDLDSAFLAGKRFRDYRASSKDRSAILADFLIGAHAVGLNAALLTRDTRIYRNYFPELTLITPESTK